MNRTVDIICVGQACLDVLIGWNGNKIQLAEKERTVSTETVLDIGGDGANLSIILSRLGCRVRFFCPLGEDIPGEMIQNRMLNENVELGQKLLPGVKTQIVSVFVREKGERSFIFGGQEYQELDLPDEALAGCRILSLNSMLRAPLDKPEQIIKLAKNARERGALVCADVYTKHGCSFEPYRKVLPYLDYLFLNKDESDLYTGRRDYREAAELFRKWGARTVVIKLGSRGCYGLHGESGLLIPAFKVDKTVDATGAGDCFMAGFEMGLLEGKDFRKCCELGAAVAAAGIGEFGATGGVRSREQVEEYLSAGW